LYSLMTYTENYLIFTCMLKCNLLQPFFN